MFDLVSGQRLLKEESFHLKKVVFTGIASFEYEDRLVFQEGHYYMTTPRVSLPDGKVINQR